MSQQFVFVLGRETELCAAELTTLLSVYEPTASSQTLPSGAVLVQPSAEFDHKWWVDRLGGTRLIARVAGELRELSAEQLNQFVPLTVRELAISGPDVPHRERMKILLELKKLRPGLRYRPTDDAYLASGLSERLIRRDDATEFLVLKDPTPGVGYQVGEVVAVQDTRAWAARDRGLPTPDPVAGMLPPKLARIMVNLAEPARERRAERICWDVGGRHSPLFAPRSTLLDPFCGSGQIPIEGLRTSWDVVASDLDPAAVERTRTNLEWVQTRSRIAAEQHWEVLQSDVADLVSKLDGRSVDAIVTEPNLGPPLRSSSTVPSEQELASVTRTIRTALDVGRQLLRPGGRLVVVIPIIAGQRIAERVDDLAFSGYRHAARLHYARPDARVEREIFVLDRV